MLPDLDRHGPDPIYQQIQRWMRTEIATGRWPEHYKLASEIDLAANLNVNRATLRNAISGLIEEGLLIRIHGKGTFVASMTGVEQPLAESLITFTEGFIAQHISFVTTVLEQKSCLPNAAVRTLLALGEKEEAFFLKRVRNVRGEPLILLENYVVHGCCQGIERTDFTRNSLFDTLENHFQLKIDWGRRFFQARAADKVVARFLNVPVGSPIMYVQQIVYLADGSPIEMSNLWIKGDHFQVSATVKRGSKRSQIDVLPAVEETFTYAEAAPGLSTKSQQE
jgi:DNA-binding GntR family transcriptional regulator